MTRPVLAVMAGWFDGKLGADIHAQLAEFNPVKISSPWKHGGWPSKRLLGWKTDSYIDKQAPHGPFVALGFSWGAHAAARLAERNPHCVGLIYISGLEWSPFRGSLPAWKMLLRWRKFPAICLCMDEECERLQVGTLSTFRNLTRAGANVTCPDPAPAPTDPDTGEPYKRPHLAGVAHHLPAIRAWVDQHYGTTP